MPTLPSPLLSLALLAALAAGAALGFKWRDNTAKLAESRVQQRHTQALNHALDQARKQEQSLYAQMEALSRDAEKQLQDLAAAERAAADTRVRDLAREYANRTAARTNPAPDASCQAAETRARMLADLLAEADELAAVFAAEADRRMIAGKACEAAYQRLRK